MTSLSVLVQRHSYTWQRWFMCSPHFTLRRSLSRCRTPMVAALQEIMALMHWVRQPWQVKVWNWLWGSYFCRCPVNTRIAHGPPVTPASPWRRICISLCPCPFSTRLHSHWGAVYRTESDADNRFSHSMNLITVGCDVPASLIKKTPLWRNEKWSPSASFTLLFVCNIQPAALKNAHTQERSHPSVRR